MRRNRGFDIAPITVTSSSPSVNEAPGVIFIPPPYDTPLPTASSIPGSVCGSPSATTSNRPARNPGSVFITAATYFAVPWTRLFIRLAASVTSESNPVPATFT